MLIPVANHLLVCCYLNKLTGVPCIGTVFVLVSVPLEFEFSSLFPMSSWIAACLISSGSLFHLSTVLTPVLRDYQRKVQ